jgi:protein-tyrosine-phosphatase
MTRTVLFVCPHGAAKSRMAAAFFNRLAVPGWEASSAGVAPQAEMSANAIRLLAGTDADAFLDRSMPRPLSAVPDPARIIAIDCDLPGADGWNLDHQVFNEGMRDELQQRVALLAREMVNG